jgi:hypothetical protein
MYSSIAEDGKKKKANRKMEERGWQITQHTRSRSLTAQATLPNEQAAAALPCIQHILDANRLTWSGVGHHPDLLICELHPRQSTTRANMGPHHRHAKEMQELTST